MAFIKILWSNYLNHIIDIIIVSYIFYRLILFIKGTRALQMLYGIVILALLTFFAKQVVDFRTLGWLLSNFWVVGVIIIVIVFQPELRSALARIGSEPMERVFVPTTQSGYIKKLIPAVKQLATRKIGTLIVIEQETRLHNFAETGTFINGDLSKEFLLSIFHPGSILHDGAVIIEDTRIVAAGCILPISESPSISKFLGTRHRAALGVSEVSDAIAIVVSEETSSVSLVYQGQIEYDIGIDKLQKRLTEISEQRFEKVLLRRNITNV